jgi:hypothetical protein
MIGHAVYQMIVLVTILYAGAGEPGKGPVCDWSQLEPAFPCTNCGGFLDIPSGSERKTDDKPTQHYTIIFNTFVMMQLFNWINCRKIYHEWNVFSGLADNRIFMAIWAICFATQCLIVEVGSIGADSKDVFCDGENPAFDTMHLGADQWAFCLIIGAGSIPWQLVLITIAKTFFPDMGKKSSEGGALRTTPVPRRVSKSSEAEGGSGSGKLAAFPSGTSSIASGGRQASRVKAANETLQRNSSSGKLAEKQKAIEMFRKQNSGSGILDDATRGNTAAPSGAAGSAQPAALSLDEVKVETSVVTVSDAAGDARVSEISRVPPSIDGNT